MASAGSSQSGSESGGESRSGDEEGGATTRQPISKEEEDKENSLTYDDGEEKKEPDSAHAIGATAVAAGTATTVSTLGT